jgi:hypothetical protein
MIGPRTRPKTAKDFLIIRILKRAMVQSMDEDTMPIPVAKWPTNPSIPLPPTAAGPHGQALPHFLNAEFDETTRIASLRQWLLSQPDVVQRIDIGVNQEFGESALQLKRRALFFHMVLTSGGIVFGIIVGLGAAGLLGIGR